VEAAHRSIHPNIPGVPWWAAVLIATTATAIGYAADAALGHKELTNIFTGLYIAGCVIGILAVRQAGIFTAVIQPPLILFCAVPSAYWLFHGGKVRNIKDLLINCGYPLIERFPLMVGTAGGVLLIGLVRWYFGAAQPTRSTKPHTTSAAKANGDAPPGGEGEPRRGIAAKLAGLLRRKHDDLPDESPSSPPTGSPRVGPTGRPSRTSRSARAGRTAARSARTHSRRARPAPEDEYGRTTEQARRQSRRRQPQQTQRASDVDAADPPRRQTRRPRSPGPSQQDDADPRAQQPREPRRDPYRRRNPYERANERPNERPTRRTRRHDPYDGYDAAGPSEQPGPYQRPYEKYEPYQPYEPPRRRDTPNGGNTGHHPISQVRYRASGGPGGSTSTPNDEPRSERRDNSRAERRDRSRAPGRPQSRQGAESWEYDI
jgi:hypothetical protein